MSAWESDWFHKLGNQIMFQLTDEVDPIAPEELKLLGHDTREKRDERMTKLKENMKATTARIDYGDYSWNPVSLTQGTPACGTILGFQAVFEAKVPDSSADPLLISFLSCYPETELLTLRFNSTSLIWKILLAKSKSKLGYRIAAAIARLL